MLNRLLINCFIVLGIWSLATSARNPIYLCLPIIGISESLIRVVASRIVPSPPTLMNKSIFFLSSSCELYVLKIDLGEFVEKESCKMVHILEPPFQLF